MSVTPKKLAANRANAKKSTGPRTAAGKKRCSKNATTHGIFCNDLVLPGEDAKLFESFRHAVLLKLSPQDIVELMIVDRIVIAQWKLRRLNAVEASAHVGIAQDRIKGAREELNHERVEKFGTDEPDASHQMQQQLLDAEERDPDVINHLAVSFIQDEPFLERLSRYEQRLEMSIHRNMHELDKQKKRTHERRENGKLYCPFVSQKFYDTMHSEIRECEAELNGENEPTKTDEPKANDSKRNNADASTQPQQNRAEINEKTTESTGCQPQGLRYNPPPRSDELTRVDVGPDGNGNRDACLRTMRRGKCV